MKELKNQPHRVIVGKVRGAVGSCLFISAVVLGLLSTNYAQVQTCTPPPPNMVSWWPGDGNANDIQGGNNGTLQGGATFASGEVGQAFTFPGTSNAVIVPDNANLNVQHFTIDAWINTTGAAEQFIFGA